MAASMHLRASMVSNRNLPTGTVTLLFTDIEGSTRLLGALGDDYITALNAHRSIIRGAIGQEAGAEVDTQGDAFFAAFPSADAAVAAAAAMQRGLAASGSPVRVRIGVHTGEPTRNDDGYVGLDLHRGARICAAGHGGQVVISETTRDRVRRLPEGVRVRSIGTHRLKDLALPLQLSDLVVDGLPDTFPPLRSIDAHPTNLPDELGDLIGRADELDGVAACVREGARVVTLTGPGGTGKTTLALHVSNRLRTEFADGVFMIRMAPLASAANVPEEIARTLGLRERPGMGAEEVVADYLRGRSMLLCVDNFEHVLDAAPVLERLTAAAARVQLIVTSRVPLRLRTETELRILPLRVDASAEAPAVELFIARARRVQATFDPDDQTRATIVQICHRLDGLPLAIELAAARIRLLPPADILHRLDRPLEVASGGSRHAEARQQTMRATIEWSVGLLDARRQRLFARLGVFAGAFSVEAAEAVCSADLDDLAELLDHSLLQPADEPGRLGLLETVRAFAAEALRAGDDEFETRQRHAAWSARLAAHGGPEVLDGAHERYLDRFDAEADDLRDAFDWLIRTGQANAALALAADTAVFWDTAGHWTEGRTALEMALATTAMTNPPRRDRARALFSVARFAFQQRNHDYSLSCLAEALPVFEDLGDARGVVLCRSHAAMVADDDGAAVLALARRSGDRWSVAVALNNYADDLKATDPKRARALLSECVVLRRAMGEKRTLSITLGNVGDVEMSLGNTQGAVAAYRECLSMALDIGYSMMIADARLGLATIALLAGRADEACSLAVDALERAERLADPGAADRARCLIRGDVPDSFS